ncbi:MAG: peptide ABC transporter substrate-binding protein, partial [Treponema sp.]
EQARILKEAWEQLSLTVEVDFLPFSEYYTAVKKNEYHIGVVSWIADFADPLAFLELFRSDSSLNHTGWKNNDYEKIIAEASSERDRKKRLRTLGKAEQLLLDNRIIIPLAHIPAINIIDLNEISGWYINAVNIHPFKFIQFIRPQSLPNIVRVP